jgi:ParB-like chromosome segregation protein Spo0J
MPKKKKTVPTKDATAQLVDWAARVETVPVESLSFDPRNARRHPVTNKKAVMESLKRFGVRESLVVRRDTNVVLSGNLRLECLRELGQKTVSVVFVENESEAESAAFALAANRTAELAEWDDAILLSLVREVNDVDASLLVGWNEDEVLGILAGDQTVPELNSEGQLLDARFIITIECSDERHQKTLLEKLEKDGIECKALIV